MFYFTVCRSILCVKMRYVILCIKRLLIDWVWPVGEFPKKGINNFFRYISRICPEAPMGIFVPNLAEL